MKKIRFLFMIAFIFYFIGHFLWSYNIFFSSKIINDVYVNLPFGLFSILGLIASIQLYNFKK